MHPKTQLALPHPREIPRLSGNCNYSQVQSTNENKFNKISQAQLLMFKSVMLNTGSHLQFSFPTKVHYEVEYTIIKITHFLVQLLF